MTYRSGLGEDERLAIICETIRYCRRVRDMGMVPGGWTRALREALHFMWERREAGKKGAAQFRSLAAAGAHKLVYDHAIPFKYVQRELMNLSEPEPAVVRDILDRRLVACFITPAEDQLLRDEGLADKMPPHWSGPEYLARYEAVKIQVEPNPHFGKRGRDFARASRDVDRHSGTDQQLGDCGGNLVST